MGEIKNKSDQYTSSDSPDIKGTDKGKTTSNNKTNPPNNSNIKNTLIVIFTGLIFIVTTIYTIYAGLQWGAMKDTIARADSSIVYTRKSLDWADSANVHTREALKISDSSLIVSRGGIIAANNPYIEVRPRYSQL